MDTHICIYAQKIKGDTLITHQILTNKFFKLEIFTDVYVSKDSQQYLYGKQVQVVSDHKPLESVFKKRTTTKPLPDCRGC